MACQKLILVFFVTLAPKFAHAFDIVSGKSDLDVFQDLTGSVRVRHSVVEPADDSEQERSQTDRKLVHAGPEMTQTKRSAPQKRYWNAYYKQVDDYLGEIKRLRSQVDQCYARMRWSKQPTVNGGGNNGGYVGTTSGGSRGGNGGGGVGWIWGFFDDRRRKRHIYGAHRDNYDVYKLWDRVVALRKKLRTCTRAEQVRSKGRKETWGFTPAETIKAY